MTQRRKYEPDTAGIRLGPFWLTPGISAGNAGVLLFSGFCLICLFTFNAFVQPYLLQEVLQVPEARQGSLIGALGFVQEVIVILLVSFIGGLGGRDIAPEEFFEIEADEQREAPKVSFE